METCKIIAILHVIVFISTAILDLTRPSAHIAGFVTALAACFLSISWVLHSIICSFALSYVWNIILALLPVGLWIFIMIKKYHHAASEFGESQDYDPNENK